MRWIHTSRANCCILQLSVLDDHHRCFLAPDVCTQSTTLASNLSPNHQQHRDAKIVFIVQRLQRSSRALNNGTIGRGSGLNDEVIAFQLSDTYVCSFDTCRYLSCTSLALFQRLEALTRRDRYQPDAVNSGQGGYEPAVRPVCTQRPRRRFTSGRRCKAVNAKELDIECLLRNALPQLASQFLLVSHGIPFLNGGCVQ